MKKQTITILLTFLFVSGCVSYEEIQQQRERQLQRQNANMIAVRAELGTYAERGRLMTFRSRARSEYDAPIFDYLGRVGGTLVTSGNAEFEVRVDTSSDRQCPGYIQVQGNRYYKAVVKIYDLQGLGGGQNIIFVGEAAGCYSYDNQRAANQALVKHALYNLRF